jgi:hypothetical protein
LYRGAGKCFFFFQIIPRRWILSAADEFRKSFFFVRMPNSLFGVNNGRQIAKKKSVEYVLQRKFAVQKFRSIYPFLAKPCKGGCLHPPNFKRSTFRNPNFNILRYEIHQVGPKDAESQNYRRSCGKKFPTSTVRQRCLTDFFNCPKLRGSTRNFRLET